MFRTKQNRYLVLTVYFILICILFFLPGKAFPKTGNWMEVIRFDKWVHFGIFVVLTFLFCWCLELKNVKGLAFVFIAAVGYGLAVEIIQHYFIANRSLDVGDWAADSAGALTGLLLWRYIKK